MQNNTNIHDPPPPYTPLMQQPLPSAPPMYGTLGTTVIINQPIPADSIVIVGGCPACRIGVLEDEFTLLGLLCFFLFFPFGIICCLALRRRRCVNCGVSVY